jgi:hypothetical protein
MYFFKPNKPKLIVFGVLASFQIVMQFVYWLEHPLLLPLVVLDFTISFPPMIVDRFMLHWISFAAPEQWHSLLYYPQFIILLGLWCYILACLAVRWHSLRRDNPSLSLKPNQYSVWLSVTSFVAFI